MHKLPSAYTWASRFLFHYERQRWNAVCFIPLLLLNFWLLIIVQIRISLITYDALMTGNTPSNNRVVFVQLRFQTMCWCPISCAVVMRFVIWSLHLFDLSLKMFVLLNQLGCLFIRAECYVFGRPGTNGEVPTTNMWCLENQGII